MQPKLLIIETSDKPGLVALAEGERLLGERRLDEARQHARDLAPAVAALLAQETWRARDLDGVLVSRGPGSYTGLRVGVMSSKTLAYVLGCRLLAIETFPAIARQAPAEANLVDVIADAQQNKIYVQRFQRHSDGASWKKYSDLIILPFAKWSAELPHDIWVSGPGLAQFAAHLPPGRRIVPEADWRARADSLLALGLERWRSGESDDPFHVEPLYLRRSSAEEQWCAKGPGRK